MKLCRRLLLLIIFGVPMLSGCGGGSDSNAAETATFDSATFDNSSWD